MFKIGIIMGVLFGIGGATFAEIAADSEFPTNSDYRVASSAERYFDDEASAKLDDINLTLCYVDSLKTEQFVGQTYKALTDIRECDPTLRLVVETLVRTSRADDNSPQNTDMTLSIGSRQLQVNMSVRGGIDAANPFGRLTLHWRDNANYGTLYIEGNMVEDSIYNSNGAVNNAVRADIAGKSGSFTGGGVRGNFAFNDNNLLVDNTCYDRSTVLIKSAEYEVYTYGKSDIGENGVKVTGSGEFDFTFVDDSGNARRGYMGYGFVWTDGDTGSTFLYPANVVDIANGETYSVTYQDVDGSAVSGSSSKIAFATSITGDGEAKTIIRPAIIGPITLTTADIKVDSKVQTISTTDGTTTDYIYFGDNMPVVKDGFIITATNGNKYVLKAKEQAITYATTNRASCDSLTLPTYQASADRTPNTPPAGVDAEINTISVINGEVQ